MTDVTAETVAMAAAPPVERRHVAAAVVGNALEFYDFVTYTFFAVQIGHVFFPAHSAFIQQMAASWLPTICSAA